MFCCIVAYKKKDLFTVEGQEKANYLLTIKSEEEMRVEFDRWAAENKREYSSDEEKEKRFRIFAENLKEVNEYNSGPNSDESSFLGLNLFSDLLVSELPISWLPKELYADVLEESEMQSEWSDVGRQGCAIYGCV